MAILTEELLLEILPWVPVKSLICFKCVSKTWNSLVSDLTFVKSHLQRSSKSTHLLLRYRRREALSRFEEFIGPCSIRALLENPSMPSNFYDCSHQLDSGYFAMGSCNGLVSLLYHSPSKREFIKCSFWIWNPATRIMSRHLSDLTLHSRDYHGFGFGYDDLSDTYKMVLLLIDFEANKWEVRVQCLGDTCWRKTVTVTSPDLPVGGGGGSYGKLVNGTLSWLAIRKKTATVNQLLRIFSYDLNKETYKYLLTPAGVSDTADHPSLGVLKGCLCLYHGQYPDQNPPCCLADERFWN